MATNKGGDNWVLAAFAALEKAQELTIKYSGALPKGEIPWWKLYLKWYKEINGKNNR